MQEQKRASVKDIAAALQISLSTVHKALTGKPGISEARRKQVLRMAEELGYAVNTTAQTLSRKHMTLGVILPGHWQEFFDRMKDGIRAELEALEGQKVLGVYYEVSPVPDAQEGARLRDWLDLEKPDAILYCASHYAINAMALEILLGSCCPFFWVGGSAEQPGSISSITVDGALTGRLAADFLFCARGQALCAAVFTGSLKTPVHKAKAEAFCQRIEENGGQLLSLCQTEDDPERTRQAFEALLDAHGELNGVYVSTATSEPVCRVIQERGLTGRLTLVGTDLFDVLADYMKQGVMQATVNQNQEEVGRQAVRTAWEYLQKTSSYGTTDWRPRPQLLVKPELLLRANVE